MNNDDPPSESTPSKRISFFGRLVNSLSPWGKSIKASLAKLFQSDPFIRIAIGVCGAVILALSSGVKDTFLLWLNPRQDLVGQYTGVWHWTQDGEDQVDTDLVYIDTTSGVGGSEIGSITGHGISPKYGTYKIQGFKRNGFISLTYYCDPGTAQPTRVGSAIFVINPVDNGLLEGSWYGYNEQLRDSIGGKAELIKAGWGSSLPIDGKTDADQTISLKIVVIPPDLKPDVFVDRKPFGSILSDHLDIKLSSGNHSVMIKAANSTSLEKDIYLTGLFKQSLEFSFPQNHVAPDPQKPCPQATQPSSPAVPAKP